MGVVQRLLQQPDEVMLETGAGGELLVARMRAWANILLLMLPLANHLGGGALTETLIGLFGAVVTIGFSLLFVFLAKQQGRYRWLPYASGTYDITMVTMSLWLLSKHEPSAGINSMVIWSFYLISIFLTALRNDGRLVVYIGVLAFVQFMLLGQWILGQHTPTELLSIGYGRANGSNVVQRLVLISLVTIITATIVLRMQRLIDLAGTDSLTGIANRSWLSYRFPKLVRRARTNHAPFTLAIIDLDHFKRINDDIGHLAGDRALCHFIDVTRATLHEADWIVRLGGEEFGLVMPQPLAEATERLEQLREAVARSSFDPGEGREHCRLTFSAGACVFPDDGDTLTGLLSTADKRLAVAKRTGRNRVVADDSDVQGLARAASALRS